MARTVTGSRRRRTNPFRRLVSNDRPMVLYTIDVPTPVGTSTLKQLGPRLGPKALDDLKVIQKSFPGARLGGRAVGGK